jgi:hypothetical protein
MMRVGADVALRQTARQATGRSCTNDSQRRLRAALCHAGASRRGALRALENRGESSHNQGLIERMVH